MNAGDGVRPLLPIDYFFCSLSEDQQDKAVGIILSGTGTDGSLGLKAIKAESGLTMAQEPRSAKFAGMPQNAITLGVVDFVRPAAELGLQLCDFFRTRTIIPPGLTRGVEGKRDLDKILVYLRDQIGNDFSLYKDSTTLRRIERRMKLHQIATLPHYAQYLQTDPAEAHALFRELLIGVTSFFRDPSAYDTLEKWLPQLLTDKPEGPRCACGWLPVPREKKPILSPCFFRSIGPSTSEGSPSKYLPLTSMPRRLTRPGTACTQRGLRTT
jgi:two-component system CheB/CheR fusion protein